MLDFLSWVVDALGFDARFVLFTLFERVCRFGGLRVALDTWLFVSFIVVFAF